MGKMGNNVGHKLCYNMGNKVGLYVCYKVGYKVDHKERNEIGINYIINRIIKCNNNKMIYKVSISTNHRIGHLY